ncbi:MAG: hypothetical protein IPJ31_16535 [Bacteroidetes bacterium]|nr:hypothetical protein [Bacteroidota bacterium]
MPFTNLSGNAVSNVWNPGALVGSPTVSPVATTTYSLTGTDANGCTATANKSCGVPARAWK